MHTYVYIKNQFTSDWNFVKVAAVVIIQKSGKTPSGTWYRKVWEPLHYRGHSLDCLEAIEQRH